MVQGQRETAQLKKRFTQTFLLASMPEGYYILNDIFCWLVDDHQSSDPVSPSVVSKPVEGCAPENEKWIGNSHFEEEPKIGLVDFAIIPAINEIDSQLSGSVIEQEVTTVVDSTHEICVIEKTAEIEVLVRNIVVDSNVKSKSWSDLFKGSSIARDKGCSFAKPRAECNLDLL